MRVDCAVFAFGTVTKIDKKISIIFHELFQSVFALVLSFITLKARHHSHLVDNVL